MADTAGEALVRRYLAGMETHDLDLVLGCFTPDGVIKSPTYGVQRAADFSPQLFADSLTTEVSQVRLFRAADGAAEWIAVFAYHWHRAGKDPVRTRLCDRFVLTHDSGAILSLEISNIGPDPDAG